MNLVRPDGVKYFDRAAFEAVRRMEKMVDADAFLPNRPEPGTIEDEISLALDLDPGRSTIRLDLGRSEPPKILSTWIHVSNGCNLSCRYCYIPELRKGLDGERAGMYVMSTETALRTIETLFSLCQRNGFKELQLKFAGGEPTLAPDVIIAACERAEELAFETGIRPHFRILTNGVFDHEVIIPILRRFKFGVSVSVDGDPEPHDTIRFVSRREPGTINFLPLSRGRSGTWTIVSATIDALLSLGIKPFILCTVGYGNYRQLRQMIAYCRDRRIGFRLSPVRDATTYKLPGFQTELATELSGIYQWIAETYPPTMPIERFAGFAEWNLRRKKNGACGSCKSMVGIDKDGALASCQMRLDHPIANVEDDDAIEFLQMLGTHEDYKLISRPDSRSGSCVDCDFESTCAGGCPEHTRMAFGTTDSASPWCDLYTAVMPAYVEAIAMQIKQTVSVVGASI
jgi:uncharacterized protein